MECPNCKYHDFDDTKDAMKHIDEWGIKGEFYKLGVELKRNVKWEDYKEECELYACPNCLKLFIVPLQ